MTKFLIVLAVIAVAVAWIAFGRRGRGDGGNGGAAAPQAPRRNWRGPRPAPATMVACAHCGVHLPQPDALLDAAGRPFCSEAHRLAGPQG